MCYLPYVCDGGFIASPLVAEVDFRTAYAAVVEVGGQPRGRHVHTLVLDGAHLAHALDDDADVHDGVLLVVGLEDRLVGELLQWERVVRQPCNHKILRHPLVVHGGFSV